MPETTPELLKAATQYLVCYDTVKEYEQKLEAAKHQRSMIERLLVDLFASTGVESLTISPDGERSRTLSPSRDILPSIPAELKENAIAVFRENGLDDLVIEMIQPGRLKSWVKEQPEDPDTTLPKLPGPIAKLVKLFEKWGISTRAAPKKRTPKKKREEVIELEP